MQQGRGTLILVLGILSCIIGCFPIGIAAWVMANHDLRGIEDGTIDPVDQGLIKAGKIMGIISLCLFVVGVIVFFAFGLLAVLMSAIGM